MLNNKNANMPISVIQEAGFEACTSSTPNPTVRAKGIRKDTADILEIQAMRWLEKLCIIVTTSKIRAIRGYGVSAQFI